MIEESVIDELDIWEAIHELACEISLEHLILRSAIIDMCRCRIIVLAHQNVAIAMFVQKIIPLRQCIRVLDNQHAERKRQIKCFLTLVIQKSILYDRHIRNFRTFLCRLRINFYGCGLEPRNKPLQCDQIQSDVWPEFKSGAYTPPGILCRMRARCAVRSASSPGKRLRLMYSSPKSPAQKSSCGVLYPIANVLPISCRSQIHSTANHASRRGSNGCLSAGLRG